MLKLAVEVASEDGAKTKHIEKFVRQIGRNRIDNNNNLLSKTLESDLKIKIFMVVRLIFLTLKLAILMYLLMQNDESLEITWRVETFINLMFQITKKEQSKINKVAQTIFFLDRHKYQNDKYHLYQIILIKKDSLNQLNAIVQ